MPDQGVWSLNLGRWGGVHLRLHIFFLLFAAFALYFGWQADPTPPGDYFMLAAISVGILLASVVLHEIGHYHAARFYGGAHYQMVLGPLGGLSALRPPRAARHEVIAHLAGPLVNLSVCGLCLLAMGTSGLIDRGSWLALLNPLHPGELPAGDLAKSALVLAVWINWMLFLINLLPAFPFDGGRALRAALSQVLPRRNASLAVARLAQIAAFGLVICACLMVRWGTVSIVGVPPWFALALLGIFLFFSARLEQERGEVELDRDDVFHYDFSEGYTSLDRSSEVLDSESIGEPMFARWRRERRAAKLRREREREEEDERRVDEVLARLHATGMESLSAEDRALLQRVSARYRNRSGNGA